LDVFLLHCLQSDSPDDTPQEIAAIGRNQHQAAERGREPGLELERGQDSVTLAAWGLEIVQQLKPIAAQLDAEFATDDYSRAVLDAEHTLLHPETTPSARVLKAVQDEFDGSFVAFVRAQSLTTRQAMLDLPMPDAEAASWAAQSLKSVQDQVAIEAADTMPFDIYLQEYLSPKRLVAKPVTVSP
jgi:glutamate--cysteine ligase